MMISDQSVFLSLAIGVVLGFFLVINKVIVARNRGRGLLVFLADFTFAAICIMVTFIASIPLNKGRVRFLQVALELIGMLAFSLAFGDAAVAVSAFLSRGWNALTGLLKKGFGALRGRVRKRRERRKASRRRKKRQGKLAKPRSLPEKTTRRTIKRGKNRKRNKKSQEKT